MKKKEGFTLAEILISLTILGALAAILFPLLHKYSPDKNKIMFRKGYYTIEKAVSQLANDEIHYPSGTTWAGGDCTIGGVSVECLFHNTTLTGDIPGANDKFCYLLSDFLNTIGTIDCTTGAVAMADVNTWNFKTTDGIKWRVLYYDSSDPFNFTSDINLINAMIIIDVNGAKDPNCSDYTTLTAMEWSGATACQNETTSKDADIHGVMIRYDGKILLDPNDTFENEALSDPTKFTKEK